VKDKVGCKGFGRVKETHSWNLNPHIYLTTKLGDFQFQGEACMSSFFQLRRPMKLLDKSIRVNLCKRYERQRNEGNPTRFLFGLISSINRVNQKLEGLRVLSGLCADVRVYSGTCAIVKRDPYFLWAKKLIVQDHCSAVRK